MKELPRSSKVVIIGGGIVGCSTAYHLAQLGVEVLLIEKNKLTSGSTFHAAGLIGQLRTNSNITQLIGYSIELYSKLEEETGLATGLKVNGGLRLAANNERWTEVKRQSTTAQSFGLEMELLTPKEALSLWPIMETRDLVGAAFLPNDCQANPSDITIALAKGARLKGASIIEDTSVLELIKDDDKITGVKTSKGDVNCEKVVCCAGQWSRELSMRFGINVPLISYQHQYLVTEKIESLMSNLPTLRDPDNLTYFKEEVGGLVMGGYETNPKIWANKKGIPDNFNFSLLEPDYNHFEVIMKNALRRVPLLNEVGVKSLINGPESFTPDGNFILGEAPEQKNYFIGAGFNAYGIASGGGAGMALAEWVRNGLPPFDLWPVDITRFGLPHGKTEWLEKRTYEAYSKHYTIAWPFQENESARPFKVSPIYKELKKRGAVFGEKLGWERPNWFSGNKNLKNINSFKRQEWFYEIGEEHKSAREKAVIIDQTSFAKFLVSGEDAERFLNYICANDISKPVGSLIYTQMLNEKGGIETDVIIARTSKDSFYIISGTGFMTHDYHWINLNLNKSLKVKIENLTELYSVFSIMGPKSREILNLVCEESFENINFPFGTFKDVLIANCPAKALRVSFLGELGWELHFETRYAEEIYGSILNKGQPLGLKNAGYRVIESCRLEKGYRVWGQDLGPDYTPLEAGLIWATKINANVDFSGKKALLDQRRNGIYKIFAGFTCMDRSVVLLGRETIFRNGKKVGWLSSGGYGYTIKKPIGYGYIRTQSPIDAKYVLNGNYSLEVENKKFKCDVHLKPLYDPMMKKIMI